MIGATVVLENSGEESLGEVTHLVLRNGKYRQFAPGVAQELTQLESISLSGNAFTSLSQFAAFPNLRELNLNFNSVGELAATMPHMPSLCKLFLSCNNLTNECLGPLPRQTPNLRTLCLYRNKIRDLVSACHVLKALTKLKELDLAGNPCCNNHAGYKHVVLAALPHLRTVDNEPVQDLDLELAREFVQQQNQQKLGKSPRGMGKGRSPPLARPSTAPVRGRKASGSPGASGADAGAGTVQLFRSKFLNSNPILLQYLAQTSVQTPVQWDTTLAEADEEDGSSEFDVDAESGARVAGSPGEDTNILHRAIAARDEQAQIELQSNISQRSQTVHKLLQTIEHLKLALAEANRRSNTGRAPAGTGSGSDSDTDRRRSPKKGASGGDGDLDELIQENRALHAENANLYCIQEENRDLKAKLAALEERNSRLETLASSKYALQLEQEVQHLRGENANLKEHISVAQFDFELQRPRTSAEVLNDCEEEIDAEVSELIRRNGEELRQLRQTLKATKREMNMSQQRESAFAADGDHDGSGSDSGGGGWQHDARSTSSPRGSLPIQAALSQALGHSGPRTKTRHTSGAVLKGKLKPIMDLVAKRKQKKKRDKQARASSPGESRSPRVHTPRQREHAPFERPTTANLIRRDISTDKDVAEAMLRVEQAQAQMQQLRAEGAALGTTASKYSRGSQSSTGADILVIQHDD